MSCIRMEQDFPLVSELSIFDFVEFLILILIVILVLVLILILILRKSPLDEVRLVVAFFSL